MGRNNSRRGLYTGRMKGRSYVFGVPLGAVIAQSRRHGLWVSVVEVPCPRGGGMVVKRIVFSERGVGVPLLSWDTLTGEWRQVQPANPDQDNPLSGVATYFKHLFPIVQRIARLNPST